MGWFTPLTDLVQRSRDAVIGLLGPRHPYAPISNDQTTTTNNTPSNKAKPAIPIRKRDKALKAASKTKHLSKRTVEIFNLKTEKSLKNGSIHTVNDDELFFRNGATRRSVSASVLGLLINVGLAVACPPFAASAAINAWQIGVSATNRHRVRREVKRRAAEDPAFIQKYKASNKPVRDILVGCATKAVFSAATMGVVGIDNIVDAFEHVVTAAATQAVGAGAADGVAYNQDLSLHSGAASSGYAAHQATEHLAGNESSDGPRAEDFKQHHPRLSTADKIFHSLFAVGDWFAEGVGHVGEDKITMDTTWDKLGDIIEKGVSAAEVAALAVTIGAVNELVQPVTKAAEWTVDKGIKYRDLREWPAWLKWMERTDPATAVSMKPEEQQSHAKKLHDMNSELKDVLLRRRNRPASVPVVH